jgi:hypothetical protein
MNINYTIKYSGREGYSDCVTNSDSEELRKLASEDSQILDSLDELKDVFMKTMSLITAQRPGKTIESKLVIQGELK